MKSVVADTHAVVWYLAESARLSARAKTAMSDAIGAGFPVFVSTMTLVELSYLVEKGKLKAEFLEVVFQTLKRADSGFQAIPFTLEIAEQLAQIPRSAIPDMPDRMIAATSLHLDLPLVTADHRIREAKIETIW